MILFPGCKCCGGGGGGGGGVGPFKCYTDGTNYQCVGADETPPVGWTTDGVEHATRADCAGACGGGGGGPFKCYTDGTNHQCVGADETPPVGWTTDGVEHATRADCAGACGGGGGGDCNPCPPGSTIASLGETLTLTVNITEINFLESTNNLSDQSEQESVIQDFFNTLSVPYQNPAYIYGDRWVFLGCIDGRNSNCSLAGDGSGCDSKNSLTTNHPPELYVGSTQGEFKGSCHEGVMNGQFQRTTGYSAINSAPAPIRLVTAQGCGLVTVDGHENVFQLQLADLVFDWNICSASGRQKVSCNFESPNTPGVETYAAVAKPYGGGFVNIGYYAIKGTAFLESDIIDPNPLP